MTDRLGTVLIFGSGGQVGRELIHGPAPRGFAMHGLAHAETDIADCEAVEEAARRHWPGIIVNAAAYTAVDKAEFDVDRAFAVNEAGPRWVPATSH
jgi:dTDP-4-dehydrorhamnose reductase